MHTLQGHTDYVLSVCRLDSRILASGSRDNTLKIWDFTTGQCMHTLQGHTRFCLVCVSLGFPHSGQR